MPVPTVAHEALFRNGLLEIPGAISAAYVDELHNRQLYSLVRAAAHPTSKAAGGAGEDETNWHFAGRFLNSVSRPERLILEKDGHFRSIPDDLMQTFSDGEITVVDIPCGTGGTFLGFVGTIMELRKLGLLPSQPVSIRLIGADISESALEIYSSMIDRVSVDLAAYGILLQFSTQIVDLLDVVSVAKFCKQIDLEVNDSEVFVLIGNITELSKTQMEAVTASATLIMSNISPYAASLLWIEHGSNNNENLFKRTLNHFSRFIAILTSVIKDTSDMIPKLEYKWRCPIQEKSIRSHVSVLRYDRTRANV